MVKCFSLLLFLLTPILLQAQKNYTVAYKNQADIKVFVVKYENQILPNNGTWYFTKYKNQAEKNIFFVDYENQADLKIFYVDYKNKAGWNNLSKKYLFH